MLERPAPTAEAALAAVRPDAIARDTSRLVRVPSVTGDERAAVEEVLAMADELGLRAELAEHDLEQRRAGAG